MLCDHIKNGPFSFKIVCENNLKRASDCFSDTLEIQIFAGEIPRTLLTRGGQPTLPLLLLWVRVDCEHHQGPFPGLRLLLQIIKWGKNEMHSKALVCTCKVCIFAVLALIAKNRKSCGFQGSSSRSHSRSLSWFLPDFPSKHCLFLQLWVKLFLYEC